MPDKYTITCFICGMDKNNPKIRQMKIDWNCLDTASRKVVSDFAHERGYTVLVVCRVYEESEEEK